MDEQKLLSTLSSINSWWNGSKIPKSIKKSDHKRKVYYNIINKCLKDNLILSLAGPRQVGKTTLMGQLIEYQIEKEEIDQRRIIYIPTDNELLKLHSEDVLMDCLKVFLDYSVGESAEKLKSKIYVYLDEIQTLEDWSKKIKSYYDSYENIKFIISGSSHTQLYTDASESLVGRIRFRILLPFKFIEFLDYNLKENSRSIESFPSNMREAFKKTIMSNDPEYLVKELKLQNFNLSSDLPKIKKILDTYLIKGGYPGLLEYQDDFDLAVEKTKTDLELTVYKDIYKTFNTRNSSEIMSLLTLLANASGQKVNHSSLANSLGIDRRAVASYIHYAKLLFLLSESPFYRENHTKRIEKMSKVYFIDTGIRNVLLGKMNERLLAESNFGLVIQNAVYNHARNIKFCLNKYTDFEVYYWEDKLNEVDVVINLPEIIIPIEVKSRSGKKGVKAINKFIEKHNSCDWGIIITKDELDLKDKIVFMPLWAFLMMC